MKLTKIIPIRLIKEKHDTDWDGVSNYRDCEPLNPRAQHTDKYHVKRWHVKSSWYPESKVRGEEREEQTDVFLKTQEAEDINLVAHHMFAKDFTQLSEGEKKAVRKAFIWGW